MLVLDLLDKMDLRRGDKPVAFSGLCIYYKWKNIKKSYQNNKLKISRTTRDKEFELPDRSYSVSDIQDYSEYIIKKHETLINHQFQYVNEIQNRITFKIKTGYYLKVLTLKTELLGSTERKVIKAKNCENVPQ